MYKIKYYNIIILLICIFVNGCGRIENNTGSSMANNTNTSSSNINSSSFESKNPDEYESSSDNIIKPETDKNLNSPDVTKKPKIKKGKLSKEQNYSDVYRTIEFLGLKEYKELKSDLYTDIAPKNKKFLVLFLSIKNRSNKEDYINYQLLSCKLDGKEITHTVLFNEPKNYPTIFQHIEPNAHVAGFIVWKVPKNWNKLEIVYDGWKDIDNVSLIAEFKPKDLIDPIIYNKDDYI